MYNYFESVKEDAKTYLLEECNSGYLMTADTDEIIEEYFEDLVVSDSVTGDASGSYTCNSYMAMENLIGNSEVIEETLYGLGLDDLKVVDASAERLDVLIRIYLLPQAMEEAIEEIKEEM